MIKISAVPAAVVIAAARGAAAAPHAAVCRNAVAVAKVRDRLAREVAVSDGTR